MISHWLIGFIAIAMWNCVTTVPAQNFQQFPARFFAFQHLEITLPAGETESLLAELTREGDSYSVTFIHPAFQVPVLRLGQTGQDTPVVEHLTDEQQLPFDPKLILKSIVELYGAATFAVDPIDKNVLTLTSESTRFELRDFFEIDKCVFPGEVVLTIQLGKTPSQPVQLRVRTKDLDCKI